MIQLKQSGQWCKNCKMNNNIELNGFDNLSVSVAGEGDPLLLIHGIISDSSFFAGISQVLMTNYKVITYDRRGYGNSLRYEEMDFSVAEQAHDVADILTRTCRESAWIVGNSAGGLIALEVCMKYPDLVRGMLLIEPSFSFDPECQQKMEQWNQELNSYLASGHIKRALPAFNRVIGINSASAQSISLSEMKKVYDNLFNFMHGELNEIQRYAPLKRQLSLIHIPIQILVTDRGKDSIFGKASLALAKEMGWKTNFLSGYHNALKDDPITSANYIHKYIEEMKNGEK